MAELKGGTTGQVLSKTSATDMDFTWVAQDDSNAIQNAIVDAKGDLIAASANDTPARLAVGNNGETLVADSSASVGLSYQSNFAAGKNKIINGDFRIWQRGLTFSSPTVNQYLSDRWFFGGGSNFTGTINAETFTPGTAPVAGYEGQYFWRFNGSATTPALLTRIEDVRTFAGQTVTFSFWAKANASFATGVMNLKQEFGSGGSAGVNTTASGVTLTTSWARYSFTIAIPSIAGKTIGTSSFLQATINFGTMSSNVVDIWGVQLEAGSVATAFQTATGTIQGELSAAQRYFVAYGGSQSVEAIPGWGSSRTTTAHYVTVPVPPMRTTPSYSVSAVGDWDVSVNGLTSQTCTALSLSTVESGPTCAFISVTTATNASLGSDKPIRFAAKSTAARMFFSAEL
jgi:hypothetical protein